MPVTASLKRRLAAPALRSARFRLVCWTGHSDPSVRSGGSSNFRNRRSQTRELRVRRPPDAGRDSFGSVGQASSHLSSVGRTGRK